VRPRTSCLPAALAVILARAACADTVTLRDGRSFQGRILDQSRSALSIDTIVAGVRATLTFPTADIALVRFEKLPPGFFDSVSPPPAPPARPAPPAPPEPPVSVDASVPADVPARAATYAEVPIQGIFGQEVTAAGLRDALEQARARGIRHVVFTIDSPGGDAAEMHAVAQALADFDDDFSYHALIVRQAFSAAVFLLACSDTIHVQRGSASGAAVGYVRDATTGQVEVDAKFNAALAAQLAAAAERRGHAPLLFRAMVQRDLSVFAWTDDAGEPHLAAEPPVPSPPGLRQIDSPERVLSMTGDEMVALGFARGFAEDAAGIGPALGIEPWRSAGDFARRATEHAASERARFLADFQAAAAALDAALSRARAADPRRQTVSYSRYTGLLTPRGQAQWRRFVDVALAAWSDVAPALRRLRDLEQRRERLGLARLQHGMDLAAIAAEAEGELRWLRERRSAYYIDQTR